MEKTKNRPFTVAVTGDIDTFEKETENCLSAYLDTLEERGIKGSFPITAEAARNYPERARLIVRRGHEILGHGDIHTPFTGPVPVQVERMKRMIDILFDVTGVRIQGARAPFIHNDDNMYKAMELTGLSFDSTPKVFGMLCKYLPYYRRHYVDSRGYPLLRPILNLCAALYNLLNRRQNAPFQRGKITIIPLIGDSDFTLIDYRKGPRFSQTETKKIANVWLEHVAILKKHHRAVALQAHPVRVSPHYLDALRLFCDECLKNGVQFASLGDIAANETQRRAAKNQ